MATHNETIFPKEISEKIPAEHNSEHSEKTAANTERTENFRHTVPGGLTFVKKSKASTNPHRHFHPWWEIMYISSGRRTFFYGKRTVQVEEGTFVFIAPGILHRAISREKETCSLINVFFEDERDMSYPKNPMLEEVIQILKKIRPFVRVDGNEKKNIDALFSRISAEIHWQETDYGTAVWSLLNLILVYAERNGIPLDSTLCSGYSMNNRFSEILDWINCNYSEPMSLTSVARKFTITPEYLSRCFKEYTQFTFVEYISNLRIAESCKLLADTNRSVLEIALKCGFGSVTQYGRWFRKLIGKSPLQYRRH